MVDLGPSRKRIAKLLRMLSSSGGERRNAFTALDRTMQSANVSWTDIGDAVEHDEGKYTESEMREFVQAARAEGVEAGIKIGLARVSSGSGNGHLTLPEPNEMAKYCYDRLGRLKDDAQRDFVSGIYVTKRASRLSRGELGYLASIYIKHGGKI
jgi:hypothetical protein